MFISIQQSFINIWAQITNYYINTNKNSNHSKYNEQQKLFANKLPALKLTQVLIKPGEEERMGKFHEQT